MRIERLATDEGTVVLVIAGEIDLGNAHELQHAIESAVASLTAVLVVDLSDVSFMDSTGLAVLVAAAQRSTRLEVRNPSPIIRRVIEMTGLSEVLTMTSVDAG